MKKIFFHYFSPLFFILAFLFFMYSIPVFHIRDVFITGTEKVDVNFLKKIVKNKLSERYIYILDKDHIWFYPKKDIEKEILNSNPRIREVKIETKNWWRDLNLEITERKEDYLYCKEKTGEEKNIFEKCFSMDKEGFVFGQADKNKTLVKFYGSSKKYKKNISEINKIISFFKKSNLKIKEIRQDELGDLIFILEGGSKILLDKNFKSENILKNIRIIFSYHDFKIDKSKNKFKNKIYYINLRHGSKIYYCLNNKKCAGNY